MRGWRRSCGRRREREGLEAGGWRLERVWHRAGVAGTGPSSQTGSSRQPPASSRKPSALSRAPTVKLAFIVQRYGTEILGGSEYHCRLIAERLAQTHEVEVLTTCARDYITWKNEYPEGTDRVRGVTVRRFATAMTRDIEAFNRQSDWIFHHPHTADDEMEWLKQQGPWSPALLDHLARRHQQFDALDLLHLSLRADGARAAGRAEPQHPGPDRARRAGHSPGHLQGDVQPACGGRLQHRRRAALPDHPLPHPRGRGGNGRVRRRPARLRRARAGAARREQPAARTRHGGPPLRRLPAAAAAHHRARRGVPPPSPAAWPVRALRRAHRSRQGLRGADRVLQLATSWRAAMRRWR